MKKHINFKVLSCSSFFKGILDMLFMFFISRIFSGMINDSIQLVSFEPVLNNIVMFSILFIVYIIYSFLSNYYYDIYKTKQFHFYKMNYIQDIYHEETKNIFQIGLSNILQYFKSDLGVCFNFKSETISLFIKSLILIIFYGGYISYMHIGAFAVITVIGILKLIPTMFISYFEAKDLKKVNEIESKIRRNLMAIINGFTTLKLFQAQKWQEKKLHALYGESYEIQKTYEMHGSVEYSLTNIVDILLKYITVGAAFFMIYLFGISIELSVQIIILSGSYYAALHSAFNIVRDTKVYKMAKERISDIKCSQTQTEEINGALSLTESVSIYSVNDISVSYDDVFVIKDFSYQIDKEGIYLFKGKNGSGKTSFVNCLLNFQTVNKGLIEFLNEEIDKIPSQDLYQYIAYMPQEIIKFNMTIQDFVEVVSEKNSLSPNVYIDLLAQFGIQKEQLNQNINNLSDGESRKVLIVALLNENKPIIILDEPTNHLDKRAKEKLVQILKNRKEQIIIIISHDTIFNNISDCMHEFSRGGDKL